MNTLSVIILTKNEEKNIAAVIENAKQVADEVLIVDSGSTDGTVELAKGLGARVVYRVWDNDFAAQRNFALTQTECDWVLYLDADERMNEELVKAVKNAICGSERQYSFQRRAVVCGYIFNYGALKPDKVFRLFPRKQVFWENKVHERPVSNLAKEQLAGEAEHFTYDDWQSWIQKMGKYTDIWATDSFQKGKRTSLLKVVIHTIMGFFKVYFLKYGFLDGLKGLISSFSHCTYTMFKYLKLLELQRNIGVK